MENNNSIKIKRKGTGNALQLRYAENSDGSLMPVLYFPALEKTGVVRHLFTTRFGGVSSGIFSSMNLSSIRGDDPACVDENFRRAAAAVGLTRDRLVLTCQVHSTKIIRVGEEDAGKGVTRELDWNDVDGLVTDTPNLALATFFADCVPIMIVDPVRRAIGSCHSGWKGTVRRIGEATIRKMQEEFGSDPKDLVCGIGPSICRDCYEISGDVAARFKEAFPGYEQDLLTDKHNGHYQLDLWEACRRVLLDAGVPEGNISVTDVCTCCNPDVLFSHRATQGKRGNIAGLITLV